MASKQVALWKTSALAKVPDSLSDPAKIAERAIQLRERERSQIASNFSAENYEIVATFVWARTMALLKKQLATLGSAFIGELLQRPDIDENSDIGSVLSDAEAISLGRDLGILTPLQTIRLNHSQEIVTHFAGVTTDPQFDQDEMMTREDALSCLRVCVQGVLGHETVSTPQDFRLFREKLSSETFTPQSSEIAQLKSSPYFFVRTAISMLLTLIRTSRGAQLEHASRNALLIIKMMWAELRDPERWQIGQIYAAEFSEGKKDAVKALYGILVAVHGFDYVPENLRSETFARAASNVIAAHQGLNNFYNEPGPMKELASLGTSIPSPALAKCVTAVLCVKLGNSYGASWEAQSPAEQMIRGISKDRWVFYLDGRLDQDRIILPKLTGGDPRKRWISLVKSLGIKGSDLKNRSVRPLIDATISGNLVKVGEIADKLYRAALDA